MADYIIDLDSTLNRLLRSWKNAYNTLYDDNIELEDIKGWNIADYMPKATKDQVYDILNIPNFFKNIMPMPRARIVVDKLRAQGDSITVVSAYTDAKQLGDKEFWLKAFMDIDRKDTCFTAKKSIVKGDIMIDDKLGNLVTFDGIRILYSAQHNLDFKPEDGYHFRCNDWFEVEQLLLGEDKYLIDAMLRP